MACKPCLHRKGAAEQREARAKTIVAHVRAVTGGFVDSARVESEVTFLARQYVLVCDQRDALRPMRQKR